MSDRMGPPPPQEYAPRQMEGRQEEPKFSIRDMYPLLASQAGDLISTEYFLRTGNPYAVEKNPLPGMQHSLGRAGWGAVELAGAQQLLKHNPKLGKLSILGLAAIHGLLSRNNFMRAEQDKTLLRITR